jgi:hypothetical protein
VERARLELLRRLALSDPHTVQRLLCGQVIEPPLLNERTCALVRLAALAVPTILIAIWPNLGVWVLGVQLILTVHFLPMRLVAQLMVLGIPVGLAVMNFAFIGGSMGSAVGEVITRAIRRSIEHQAPLLIISQSGGARMMEGLDGHSHAQE